MDELTLVIPTLEHKQDAMEFRREFLAGSPSGRIDGSAGLHHYENYEEWLDNIEKNRSGLTPGLVSGNVYFGIYNGNIVGIIAIRHYLNKSLLIRGGHIGYGVRPSERRKGYATKMLALALEECKKLGVKKALVTCDKDNIGSARTIQKNGGVLENEITDDNVNFLQRYWIEVV